VNSIAFSPNGQLLAFSDRDYIVSLWDVQTGQRLRRFEVRSRTTSVAFSPTGQILASGNAVWDVQTGARLRELGGDAVAFSPDGQILALTSSFDQTRQNPFRDTIQLWDVQTGQQLSTLTGHTDRITGILFAPDGRTLVSASQDGTIRLWGVP
jgi:WD40 repeat protein